MPCGVLEAIATSLAATSAFLAPVVTSRQPVDAMRCLLPCLSAGTAQVTEDGRGGSIPAGVRP